MRSPQVSDESAALGWFAPDALPTPLADATDRLVLPGLAAARDLTGNPSNSPEVDQGRKPVSDR